MKKQHGFSIVELLLVGVVLVIFGSVGYLAYTNFTNSDQDVVTNKNTTTTETITSAEDIDKTIGEIDSLPTEDDDLSELNLATQDF